MYPLAVHLDTIAIDECHEMDFSGMPTDIAVQRLRSIYSQICPGISVEVRDNIGIILFPEIPYQTAEAIGACYWEAMESAEEGSIEQAIRNLKIVLRTNPTDVDARKLLAEMLMRVGDVEGAKVCLTHAVQLHSSIAWPYLMLATIFEAQKDLHRACLCYSLAHEREPHVRDTVIPYAKCLIHTGHAVSALSLLQAFVSAVPSDKEARLLMAEVLLQKQHNDAAIEMIDALQRENTNVFNPAYKPSQSESEMLRRCRQIRADAMHNRVRELIRYQIHHVETQLGFSLRFTVDDALPYPYLIEFPWQYDRPFVGIRFYSKEQSDYLLLLALQRCLLIEAAHKARRAKFYRCNTAEVAVPELYQRPHRLRDYLDGLPVVSSASSRAYGAHVGDSSDTSSRSRETTQALLDPLAKELFLIPVGLILHTYMFEQYPDVRDEMYQWLDTQSRKYLSIVRRTAGFSSGAHRLVLAPRLAMYGAFCATVANLFGWVGSQRELLDQCSILPLVDWPDNVQHLLSLLAESVDPFEPGDEHSLVDAWARYLNMETWYTWKEDIEQTALWAI